MALSNILELSSIKSSQNMMQFKNKLDSIEINNFDTTNVVAMNNMFDS